MPRSFAASTRPCPRQDRIFIVNENRIREAEPGDTVGDLAHLFPGVGARVFRIRSEPRQREILDKKIAHCRIFLVAKPIRLCDI